MPDTKRVEVSLGLNNKTVAQVKQFFEKVPDDARIRINHYVGDRPWESSSTTMTLVWDEPL